MDADKSGGGRAGGGPWEPGQPGDGETADALPSRRAAPLAPAAREIARSGELDTWLDRTEEAAMRDDDTRRRVQRVLLANLVSIRHDGGELYDSWLELLKGSLEDLGR